MKYQEARRTYSALFKKYPEVLNLFTENEEDRPITLIKKHYIKKGSRWIETENKTEKVNFIHYYNVVDPNASAFFRNLGGYEKTNCSYTAAGYIPTECISISPDRSEKSVRRFAF